MRKSRSERAPATNAYADRVTRNKKLASDRRRNKRVTAQRQAIRQRNNAPIF